MRAHYDCKLLDCKIRLVLFFDDSRRCNIRCFLWREYITSVRFSNAWWEFTFTRLTVCSKTLIFYVLAWRHGYLLPLGAVYHHEQWGRWTAWGRCILWGRACSDPGRWRGRCSYSTSHSSQDHEWWTSGCLGKISPKPLVTRSPSTGAWPGCIWTPDRPPRTRFCCGNTWCSTPSPVSRGTGCCCPEGWYSLAGGPHTVHSWQSLARSGSVGSRKALGVLDDPRMWRHLSFLHVMVDMSNSCGYLPQVLFSAVLFNHVFCKLCCLSDAS